MAGSPAMIEFDQELRRCASDVEAALERLLTTAALSGPGPAPERLVAAMRHGSLAGGKRLRPLLVRQAAGIFGVAPAASLPAGLAVEFVHCYSLVHDDLPAMDDDDMRRGRPTVHKAYDEATAILAGDTLLTHAFGLLASPEAHADADIRVRLVAELAAGAGAGGMAGGQMRDIEGEGGRLDDAEIATMQSMKTGALIRAAVRIGALLGNAPADALARLTRFAELAGRAFQLADDLLDATSTPEQLGKATGKDGSAGKQTIVSRIGIAPARERLAALIAAAIAELDGFGPEADGLRASAAFFADRKN
ncbi:MAG TPA: farnesyl diphosphate synthase [Devosia sp.]|nr:farnesyl diphosphate synthase [Devosia sp.]